MHHGVGYAYRLQDVMRHQNVKGTITGSDHALELDEQFDVIIDANDQILERVVSEWNKSCVTVSVCDSELILKRVVCCFLALCILYIKMNRDNCCSKIYITIICIIYMSKLKETTSEHTHKWQINMQTLIHTCLQAFTKLSVCLSVCLCLI